MKCKDRVYRIITLPGSCLEAQEQGSANTTSTAEENTEKSSSQLQSRDSQETVVEDDDTKMNVKESTDTMKFKYFCSI